MRQRRWTRNPIVDSPQYQAYRARSQREGNAPEDQKWPEILEMAFLDAIMLIPAHMGRRKFSFRGKPHGRNELIAEYIEIAYFQSLAPGQVPDPSMKRTRKQVSSHIQVLKGFLKDHPAYHRLFPDKKKLQSEFQDSFKDDPCLNALAQGRLPTQSYGAYEEFNDNILAPSPLHSTHLVHSQDPQPPMRPILFWLVITNSSIPSGPRGANLEELYNARIVEHKHTTLSSQLPSSTLNTALPSWRQRFPQLTQLQAQGDEDCDIIHMDVSLALMSTHPPDGAELVSRTELSLPTSPSSSQSGGLWQVITTLTKPPELTRDPSIDPPVENQVGINNFLSADANETRIKVPFPANAWAQAFTSLTNLAQKGHGAREVQQLVGEISMFQEVQHAAIPGLPYQRRAVLLWTFRPAPPGSDSSTSWRYLQFDGMGVTGNGYGGKREPLRRTVMSPSPHHSHHLMADMSENFNAFVDNSHSNSQRHNHLLDPFGLATPPHTASLGPAFCDNQTAYAFTATAHHGQNFDLPSENLSFVTAGTGSGESESTLVGEEANLDSYLAGGNMVSGLDANVYAEHGWDMGGVVGTQGMTGSEGFSGGGIDAWAYDAGNGVGVGVGWDVGVGSDLGNVKGNVGLPNSEHDGQDVWADLDPKHEGEWNGLAKGTHDVKGQEHINWHETQETLIEDGVEDWEHHAGTNGVALTSSKQSDSQTLNGFEGVDERLMPWLEHENSQSQQVPEQDHGIPEEAINEEHSNWHEAPEHIADPNEFDYGGGLGVGVDV
ncbi:TEA/ATTS domain family-domain-containing protein [Halenospora varia]|nr:TEA/ATTS domain family-domain-containing protein [Halenospora varia]